MARTERNPVRARTTVRNRAGFPRERSHAVLPYGRLDVRFGANLKEDTLYLSYNSQPIIHRHLNSGCAKAVKYVGKRA